VIAVLKATDQDFGEFGKVRDQDKDCLDNTAENMKTFKLIGAYVGSLTLLILGIETQVLFNISCREKA